MERAAAHQLGGAERLPAFELRAEDAERAFAARDVDALFRRVDDRSRRDRDGAFESGAAARLMGTVPSVVFGGLMTLAVVAVTAWKADKLRNLELGEKVG